MKTLKEILKTALFAAFIILASIDFIFIVGEAGEDTSLIEFILIKTASIITGFALYAYANRMKAAGLTPEWYNRYTDFITKIQED